MDEFEVFMDQDKKSRATLLLCDYASKHPKTQVGSSIIDYDIYFLLSLFSLHQLVYQKTRKIYAKILEIYSNSSRFANQSGVSSQITNFDINFSRYRNQALLIYVCKINAIKNKNVDTQ